jgi:hypothetical protein
MEEIKYEPPEIYKGDMDNIDKTLDTVYELLYKLINRDIINHIISGNIVGPKPISIERKRELILKRSPYLLLSKDYRLNVIYNVFNMDGDAFRIWKCDILDNYDNESKCYYKIMIEYINIFKKETINNNETMDTEDQFQATYNLVFRPHHDGQPKWKIKKCKLKKKILGKPNPKNNDYEHILFNYIMYLHNKHGY